MKKYKYTYDHRSKIVLLDMNEWNKNTGLQKNQAGGEAPEYKSWKDSREDTQMQLKTWVERGTIGMKAVTKNTKTMQTLS